MTFDDIVPDTFVAHWRTVAGARSDAIALRSPDGAVSFRDAFTHATERGRAIALAVAEPGRPVAVDVESDIGSVLTILAVLCSGHPVIVLDPFLPDERRTHILELSGAQRFSTPEVDALPATPDIVPDPAPSDAAIVIFTSGSTGRPKGVVHNQRNWVNQAYEGRVGMGFDRQDRVGVLLPLSFGAGVDCMMMGLLNGSTLLLWDVRRRSLSGLQNWFAAERATTAHCTPSLLRAWTGDASENSALPDLRLLSTCGEPIHHDDVERVRATLLPHATYCSWSGSSEMGNLAFNPIGPQMTVPAGVIPVGIPAANKVVRVMDDAGRDLPAGQSGELFVESAYLATGYFGDPALTAEKFVPIGDGRVRYRTGDLGRLDENGHLHLLGRGDDAIKVGGYLVEPAEVEAALRALPWTTDAVVTADRRQQRLTAHVAVDQHGWTPVARRSADRTREDVAVVDDPRDVVILTELPRNERGKVDRAALPPIEPVEPEPVRGPTEAALLHIWCEVLGLATVGRNEDFLSLGGDSLAAAKMLSTVSDRWLVSIPSSEFAETPTIEGLAGLLDDAQRVRSRSSAVGTITELRGGTGTPLFLAAGAGSPAASLLPVAREIDNGATIYGLQAHGLERRGRADRSIRAAARRTVSDIRSVQAVGPYRLGGYSFGAFVMLEAATILQDEGQSCEMVVLLDALFEPELLARVEGRRPRPGLGWARRTTGARAALPDRRGTDTRLEDVPAQSKMSIWYNNAMMRLLVQTAGLVQLPTTLQWTVFWDLGRRLIRRHKPTTYAGPVTLIRATNNPDDPATWRRLATGPLALVTVAGDHHSMMRAPHAAATARAVSDVLSGCGDHLAGRRR